MPNFDICHDQEEKHPNTGPSLQDRHHINTRKKIGFTYSRGRSRLLFIKKKNYRIVGIASVCVCTVDTIDKKDLYTAFGTVVSRQL